ncbi:MAG: tetratricopeptide repeat protein [Bacteroidales bacterium]|nr:tetratricopeptide repeat protein [Bacteroidales bacterium]
MKKTRCFFPALTLLLFSGCLTEAQENLPELYYSGHYQHVIDGSAALIASGDTALNTYYLKALAETQLGHPLEAIGTLHLALLIHPGEQRIIRMLARQYFEAGNYVQARKGYKDLVREDSTDVSSWLMLAEMASYGQKFDEATEALNRVLAIDTMNLSSLMMMGDILNRHNNSGAVIYYERAYRLYPDNQKAAYALGNWYIQAKEAWKAIPLCEHMLQIDSMSIRFSKLLGYAHYKINNPGKAVQWLSYAVSLGDSTSFTFKFKGISQYLLVDFAGAIETLGQAVGKDSLDAEVHFFLGACLANTTRKKEAMDHLEKSLRLMQPDPSVLSRIYSEQGNIKRLEMEYEEAYSLYAKAWESDTTNAMSLYFMASILDNSLHLSKEALVDYQRFIQALDRLPEKTETNQSLSVRVIVEDRILSLKEELFFRDEQLTASGSKLS